MFDFYVFNIYLRVLILNVFEFLLFVLSTYCLLSSPFLCLNTAVCFEAAVKIFTERIQGRKQASLVLFEGNKHPSSVFVLVVTVAVDLVADRHFLAVTFYQSVLWVFVLIGRAFPCRNYQEFWTVSCIRLLWHLFWFLVLFFQFFVRLRWATAGSWPALPIYLVRSLRDWFCCSSIQFGHGCVHRIPSGIGKVVSVQETASLISASFSSWSPRCPCTFSSCHVYFLASSAEYTISAWSQP